MKTMKQKLQRAFTITELVIVIAVIAILAAVLIPTFSSVVSSARESAAMQECSNARTTYLNETKGTLENGIVFVNNEYAYVEYSGQLHLLGKVGDLPKIDADGTVSGSIDKMENNNRLTGFGTGSTPEYKTNGIWITITDEEGNKNVPKKPLKLTTAVINETSGEVLYFYEVKVNETYYLGYFTYDVTPELSQRRIDNTVYSRAFGYVAISGETEAKMEVSATKPGE